LAFISIKITEAAGFWSWLAASCDPLFVPLLLALLDGVPDELRSPWCAELKESFPIALLFGLGHRLGQLLVGNALDGSQAENEAVASIKTTFIR